jgi:hypothetical protein
MKKRSIFSAVCVLGVAGIICGHVAFAQGTSVPGASGAGSLVATGKVVGPNEEPQAGVPVTVKGPMGKTHAFTEAKGNWSLYNLAPGKYQVQPAPGTTDSADESVAFTVEDKGFFDKLFGGKQAVVLTPEIKLDREFRQ